MNETDAFNRRHPHHPRMAHGLLPWLQGVRRLCYVALSWAVVAVLSLVWTSAARATGPVISAGPAGTFGSVYIIEVATDPGFPDPCSEDLKAAFAAEFDSEGGAIVTVTCGFDELITRYVALIEGPRCLVRWQARELERRYCVMLPAVY